MTGASFKSRYRLRRVIGGGGMAVVYSATDEALHRSVAVKLLADNFAADPALRKRFVREGRLAARLSHPGIVAVYDSGAEAGRPFIVMELVDGRTLADELARRKRLPPHEAADIAATVAAALAHAHEAGLVHRDVKPANVLIGTGGEIKLADFGIAAATGDRTRFTEVGTVLGTASYLAPEQAAGAEAGPPADIYALGAMLYEMLTGAPPYPAASLAQLAEKRRLPVPPPSSVEPDVPPWLDAIVLACLTPQPAARPSAAELVDRLSDRTAHTLASAAPTTVLGGEASRRRRRVYPGIAAAAAAVLALGGTIVAVAASRGGHPPPPRRPSIAAVPHAADPATQARLLAQWLERYSK
jgi:serine/threonine protein kinase